MPETPMQLDCDVCGDVLNLRATTNVLGPEGVRAIVQQVDTHEHCTTIRLHAAQVIIMNSAAIGALIVLHKRLAPEGRRLELLDLSPGVQEAMDFLKLDRVLTMSSTARKAS